MIAFNNTAYLYTGHDEPRADVDDYVMNNWLCFSSTDLKTWIEHPVPLSAKDFKWAKGDAYASKVIHFNDKFYWFVSVSHGSVPGKAIAVAVSRHPTEPFEDALGHALVTHDMLPKAETDKANLDPSVLIDDDGTAHMYWGNTLCYYARLNSNLTAIDGEIRITELPGFFEGAHIHKHGDWYYLSYGHELPEKVAYAMSRNAAGPWEFKGILNEAADNCETNRPATLDFRGKSYFFYHNGALPNGGSHRRSVCIDYLHYNADGTMKQVVMTSDGVEKLSNS
ncbi:glycoside hydrolase family 43 protein [Dyadobacter chenwenxiniae]|uniref:Glycoside hydrolase family 43 protein n=1 Tax=Dyadobacter chenwenxiniae TaxID=2906456 RepID=A0A9X1PK29_9BACT|nr:glycoside hydrolase family 43 protein [Dyadobacter chenwenxiniae]MCF0062792.1 glycoside hydrolase family 43 protein [Dyadobacter chenwenxiniae]UON85033.1 glycoside hydrolase family 43 protein [Dyadobacter chenwenxiniae]